MTVTVSRREFLQGATATAGALAAQCNGAQSGGKTFLRLLFSFAFCMLTALALAAQTPDVIRPGEVWLDDRGQPIQAHGGGFLKIEHTYYWFGEDRSPANDPLKRYVSCYSSKDLVHWKFRRQVIALADPENLGPHFVVERPKVFYNRKTRQFVMYMHLDA